MVYPVHVGSCWIILYTLAHMMSIWSILSYYIHPKTSTMVHMSFGNGKHTTHLWWLWGWFLAFMALFYPHHIKHGVKSQTSPGTGRNLGIWQHFFSVPLPTPALLRSWGVQQRDQHPVFSDLLGCGTVRMMANWLVVVYVYIYIVLIVKY